MRTMKSAVRPKQAVMKRWRVYVAQVNQDYVDVDAANENEAREKGYRVWRRDYAHSTVIGCTELTRG